MSTTAQNQPSVSDREVAAAFAETDAPVIGTGEVADALDITPQGAYKRLTKLQEAGELQRHKIQSNAVVWWPA